MITACSPLINPSWKSVLQINIKGLAKKSNQIRMSEVRMIQNVPLLKRM